MNQNGETNHNDESLPVPRGRSQDLGVSRPPAGQQATEESKVDFSEIWETIQRGKWIVLGTCILVTAAVTIYTLTLQSVYQASSVVSIDRQRQTASVPGLEGITTAGDEDRTLAGEVGLLQNSAVLAREVAAQLKARADSLREPPPLLRDDDTDTLLSTLEVARRLSDRVSFTALPEQNMIQISAESPVPEVAALIANAYAGEYEKLDRKNSRASVVAARTFLEEQVAKRREELRRLENRWQVFASTNEVPTEGQDKQRIVGRYAELGARRDALQFELEQARTTRNNLQRQLEQIKPELREKVMQEQAASSLKQQIDALTQKIAQLEAQAAPYYANNPDLEGDDQRITANFPQLAEINRQIEGLADRKEKLTEKLVAQNGYAGDTGQNETLAGVAELRNKITAQDLRVDELEARVQALNRRLGAYQGQLQGVPQQTIRREQLERKLAQAEKFYNTYTDRLQRTKIAEEAELGHVRQVRKAYVPAFPVSPDLRQNMILGLLLGLGFGIGLAFLRQATADRFQRPEDLQESGYSLVGVIPRMDREIEASFQDQETLRVKGREVNTHLLPLLNPWSPISENYRLVRTNLQYSGHGAPPQVSLVTSPEPSDGKTLTAANLAITTAQGGRRTLLIDADLRQPNAHRLFDLPDKPGLAEVLSGEADRESTIVGTGIDGLDLLPAGASTKPPPEALGSDRMESLLTELRARYEAIIIDSPPVLAVSDPVLLATQCDVTLLVASAGRTDRRALEVTRKTLNAVGVPIGGIIFNRLNGHRMGGYGYGYDYEEYGYAASA